jgi:hypothetical protein
MKNLFISSLIIFSLLLLAQPTLVVAEGQPYDDGYWWECADLQGREKVLCPIRQLGYVMGYSAGYDKAAETAVGVKEVVQKVLGSILNQHEKDYSWTATTQAFDIILDERLKSITYGQMMDGLTHFYADFRNKRIKIAEAFQIVRMQVQGEKGAYVDCIAEILRLNAQKKVDEASKRFTECEKLHLDGSK